jgi:hypothetical protein
MASADVLPADTGAEQSPPRATDEHCAADEGSDDERVSLTHSDAQRRAPVLVNVFEFDESDTAVSADDDGASSLGDSHSDWRVDAAARVAALTAGYASSPQLGGAVATATTAAVREPPPLPPRPRLFASSSSSSLASASTHAGALAAGRGAGSRAADARAAAARQLACALSRSLVRRLGNLLTRHYYLEQVVENSGGAAAVSAHGQRDAALRSQSATDAATDEPAPPRMQIAAGFLVLKRVAVVCPRSEPQPCMRCARRVSSGRAVVRLSHAVVVAVDSADDDRLRSLEPQQRCIVDARIACHTCAVALVGECDARATPLVCVNLPFLANRLTRHLRYGNVNGADAPVAVLRAPPDQPLRCVRCFSTIDPAAPESASTYTALIYRRVDSSSELGIVLACSYECEQIFRTCALALAQNPLVHRVERTECTLFDQRQAAPWRLLSCEETLHELQVAAARPGMPFPPDMLLHRCRNPSCWCVVNRHDELSAAASKVADAAAAAPPLFAAGVEDYAWLRRIAEALTHANVYEDVLASNDDMLCAVCKRPTDKRCATCQATHFCSQACRRAGHAKHALVCQPIDQAWSRLFYC